LVPRVGVRPEPLFSGSPISACRRATIPTTPSGACTNSGSAAVGTTSGPN